MGSERFARPAAADCQWNRHAPLVFRSGHSREFPNHRQPQPGRVRRSKLIDADFFQTVHLDVNGTPKIMVDGSVSVAGNPVYQACVEAFYYDSFKEEDTRVVSLGTGYYPPGDSVPTGLIGWLNWTVNALLDVPAERQTALVNRHFPGILQRFNQLLPNAIDMADIDSIPQLLDLGQQFARGLDWRAILAGEISGHHWVESH